jgi:hypothetical protein
MAPGRRAQRRPLISSTILAALILGAALPARAVPPIHFPFPTSDILITGDCDFDIQTHVTMDKARSTVFFDRDGNVVRQNVTGVLKETVTNVETGETMSLNLSGHATFYFNEDGSIDLVGEGQWLLFNIANRPGETLFTQGHFTAVIEPNGALLITDPAPRETNLCETLA